MIPPFSLAAHKRLSLFLLCAVFVLLVGVVTAQDFNMSKNLVAYWSFDQAVGGAAPQLTDLSGNGTQFFHANISGNGITSVGGKMGSAWAHSGTGRQVIPTLSLGTVYSSCLWQNVTAKDTSGSVWSASATGALDWFISDAGAGELYTNQGGGAYSHSAACGSFYNGLYQFVCYQRNGTAVRYYVGAVNTCNFTLNGNAAFNVINLNGWASDVGYDLKGRADDRAYWKGRAITLDDVKFLYNNAHGRYLTNFSNASAVLPLQVNWGTYAPASGYHSNVNVQLLKYNVSGMTAVYCELRNNSKFYQLNNSFHHKLAQVYNFSVTGLTFGEYNFSVRCWNASFVSSAVKVFFFDNVSPTMTLGANNFFSVMNTSDIGLRKNQKGLLDFTVADNLLLFAWQYKFYNGSQRFLNATNITISGTTYHFQRTLNVSQNAGRVYVNLSVWDAHTALEIQNYSVVKGADFLDYGEGLRVSAPAAVQAKTTKLKDRYSFEFTFDKAAQREFYVEGQDLHYLPTSPFKAHFVDWVSKRWIDFEGLNGLPEVSEVAPNRFRIAYSDVGKMAAFNSVGGLNQKTLSVFYDVYSPATLVIPSLQILDTSNQTTVVLNISGMYQNASSFRLYNASHNLINTTLRVALSNVSHLLNVTFHHLTGTEYFINVSHHNLLNDTSHSNTMWLAHLIVENCSVYSTHAAVFSFYDENVPAAPITESAEFSGSYWNSAGVGGSFSYSLKNATGFVLCFFPSSAVFKMNLELKQISDVNVTSKFYLINYSLSNITTNFDLFNFVSADHILGFKGTVRDKLTYGYMPNEYARLERHYLGEGLWRQVQMDKSGEFGTLFFNVIPNVEEYRFKFYDQQDRLIGSSEVLKFVCDNVYRACEGTFLVTAWSQASVSGIPSFNYFYNTSSRMLWVWTNSSTAYNVTFRAVRRGNDLPLCFTSFVGKNLTYSCNLSLTTGTIGAYVSLGDNVFGSGLVEVRGTDLAGLLGDADAVAWSSLIILGIAGIGFASPALGIVAAVLGLIVVSALGLMPYLAGVGIIVFAIVGIVLGWMVRS